VPGVSLQEPERFISGQKYAHEELFGFLVTDPSVKIFMSVGGMRELKLSNSSCAAV
jgi:hypothetical protein